MNVSAILPIAGVPDELLQQLNERFRQLTVAAVTPAAPAQPTTPAKTTASPSTPVASVPSGISDTHAHRSGYLASAYAGTLYYESDRNLVYLSSGGSWIYTSGTYQRTQAQLAALAATLGANDTGLLIEVTDYAHVLRWNGTVWVWGPGEEGGGHLVMKAIAPSGAGWHVCDGSTVPCLNADGTTTNVPLPNHTSGSGYAKFGAAYSSTITAKVVPTLSMNSYTPAGTNSAPSFTGSALGTHQHAETLVISSPFLFAANSPFGSKSISTTIVAQQTLTGTSSGPPVNLSLTESVTAGTPSGTVSAPAFSGSTATLSGTIALPGDPVANFAVMGYFRQ